MQTSESRGVTNDSQSGYCVLPLAAALGSVAGRSPVDREICSSGQPVHHSRVGTDMGLHGAAAKAV